MAPVHSSRRLWHCSYWAQRPGFVGVTARIWQRTYASDYVGLLLIILVYTQILASIQPFHRMFSLGDLSKSYPHALVETVPALWLFLLGGGLPLLLIILSTLITRPGFHQAHVSILGIFVSVFLTLFLTDIVKNSVGRPRPDLIARCKPKDDTPRDVLVTIDVCTATNDNGLQDGWRSFPSGHSSFAFSGLGYLALFFAGQMRVFRPRVDLTRVLVALAPIIGASLIAISRLEDYRHDAYDVTAGSLLGMTVACFSYRKYFPRLNSAKSDEPYPSRQEVFQRDEEAKANYDMEGGVQTSRRSSVSSGGPTETHPLHDTLPSP